MSEKPYGIEERTAVAIPGAIPLGPQPPRTGEYLLSTNDVLAVTLYVNGKVELGSNTTTTNNTTSGYRIDGLGNIYLPIAGEIPVAGLSIAEARNRIRREMRNYYNKPDVITEIATYRQRQVFVFGAVSNSGPLAIPVTGLNLAQAMTSARILSTGSNTHKVRIIRSNSPTDGELIVVDFDLILDGKVFPMQLQEGDIIYVPKSGIGSWNEAISEMLPFLQSISGTLQPFVNIKYLLR